MKARWNKVMEKKKGNKSEEYVQDHLLKFRWWETKAWVTKGEKTVSEKYGILCKYEACTTLNLFPQAYGQHFVTLFSSWNSKSGLSEVLGSLHQTAFWLIPCKSALLNNFCFMTISLLNCSGDKLCCMEGCCCAQYQRSFISCKMCIIKRNIYLLMKLAEGNPMELNQLLLFNSIVKINFYHFQVFAISHLFPTAFQISRNLNDLTVSQELTYRCDD